MRLYLTIIFILSLTVIVYSQSFGPFGQIGFSTNGGVSPISGACTGTINLSTGCVQPMLGGL
jgi:hypothetical protein